MLFWHIQTIVHLILLASITEVLPEINISLRMQNGPFLLLEKFSTLSTIRDFTRYPSSLPPSILVPFKNLFLLFLLRFCYPSEFLLLVGTISHNYGSTWLLEEGKCEKWIRIYGFNCPSFKAYFSIHSKKQVVSK